MRGGEAPRARFASHGSKKARIPRLAQDWALACPAACNAQHRMSARAVRIHHRRSGNARQGHGDRPVVFLLHGAVCVDPNIVVAGFVDGRKPAQQEHRVFKHHALRPLGTISSRQMMPEAAHHSPPLARPLRRAVGLARCTHRLIHSRAPPEQVQELALPARGPVEL
eukprot:2648587-Rhodomonas_salina.2